MLIKVPVFISIILLNSSVYAFGCNSYKINTSVISDNRVSVQGFIDRPFNSLVVEVYKGRDVLGINRTVSASNGSFNVNVHTKKRAGMRPDIKVYCPR